MSYEMSYARLLQLAGKFTEADAERKSVLDRRRVLGPEHPDTIWTESEYAWVLQEEYRAAAARAASESALAQARRTLRNDHPVTVMAMGNYANALDANKNPAESDRAFRELIDHSEQLYGVDSPQNVRGLQ